MTSNRIGREVHLASRPITLPTAENFRLVEVPVADPKPGQMLLRTVWMSVDPYMRGRMSDRPSYVPPFAIGQPLDGHFIGRVEESPGGKFAQGDYVTGRGGGWREWHVSDGAALTQVDPGPVPLQAYLGVMGMPGQTAHVGLLHIGRPKPGETVFVSAASGAVGAIVCQIAKLKGCRVVGSAGSDAKVAWLGDALKLDGAINYKTCGSLGEAVARLCPKGVDVYFENVGGAHLEAAIDAMNPFGRIALCGMIAQYNAATPMPGPVNLPLAVRKRLTLQGFIVSDHQDKLVQFRSDMSSWIRAGHVQWRESVVDGLERAPEALIRLFTGENFGKMLVRVGPDML
ncbi:MAG: NADP-dependent oxidoreductase [Alphaproteobacteria bacterium]|nr:NADP-dependent oxidoreductase [Alphaproteobacteria bacterium]